MGKSRNPQSANTFGWNERTAPDSPCLIGDAQAPTSVVLWGDSHAASLQTAINGALRGMERSGLAFTKSGCPPLPGSGLTGFSSDRQQKACAQFNDFALKQIVSSDAQLVILHARWAALIMGGLGEDLRHNPRLAISERHARLKKLQIALKNLKRLLADKKLLFVHAVPETGIHVPRTLARSRHTGTPLPIGPTKRSVLQRQSPVRGAIAAALGENVVQLDPVDLLCQENCQIINEEGPLYIDTHHISHFGGELLVAHTRRALAKALQ